jgi:recombination protein RecA
MARASDTLSALFREYDDYLRFSDSAENGSKFDTGLPSLNRAVGDIDGLPFGLTQIIGDSGVGKTTLSLQILAHSQHDLKSVSINGRDINALFLDFERTYDKDYAEILGVDTSKVLQVVTPFAEATFDIAIEFLKAGLQFIIIDSLPMIIPNSEAEKTMEDNVKMAAEASVIGRGLKRLNQLAFNADAIIIVLNQWRSNISPMARTEKKPYGARIVNHIMKTTIELARIKRENDRNLIEAYVSKTKIGAIGKKINYELVHGLGIDIDQHVFQLAVDYGIVSQTGKGRYEYNSVKAHGDKQATAMYPMAEIYKKVIEAMRNDTTVDVITENDEA